MWKKTTIVLAPCKQAFRFRSVIFFKTHMIKREKRKCWIVMILLVRLRLQNEIWQWIILHLTRIINIKRNFLQKEIFKIQTTKTIHQTNTWDVKTPFVLIKLCCPFCLKFQTSLINPCENHLLFHFNYFKWDATPDAVNEKSLSLQWDTN